MQLIYFNKQNLIVKCCYDYFACTVAFISKIERLHEIFQILKHFTFQDHLKKLVWSKMWSKMVTVSINVHKNVLYWNSSILCHLSINCSILVETVFHHGPSLKGTHRLLVKLNNSHHRHILDEYLSCFSCLRQ